MKNKMRVLSIILFFCGLHLSSAQNINPDLLTKPWKAQWLQVSGASQHGFGVYYFRKNLKLDQKPDKFIVHLSGDNRYKFYVNGELVSYGPARGDLYHWNFETVDLAPFLTNGENVLAAIVWNDGSYRAVAQISSETGFILQGNGLAEADATTSRNWKAIQADFYAPIKVEVLGFYVSYPGEFVDQNREFSGWMKPGFDDSQWKSPATKGVGNPKAISTNGANSWMLVPSKIPQMERTVQRISTVRLAEGIKVPSEFPSKKKDLTIPAHSKVRLLLDQTYNTNAFPVLEYSKGKNATVSLTYAETLYDSKTMEKANRNEIEGKKIIGVKDSIICNGKNNQTFTALNWKTFRYVQVSIETKNEPLVIHDLYGIFTAYPFEKKSVFTTDNPITDNIQEIGWRTARLCAAETYMDTPLYEQLQYVGDTRIQAMISYYNSGDDRLAKQAIEAIDNSRLAEGITQSCFPASTDNIISPFSLMWIGMLNDFYHYRNEPEFVKAHLPGMRQILSFYDQYKNPDGTIKNAPYWNFTDWPENARGWKKGVPPLNEDGGSAALDFQLLWAYQWAAELELALGNKGMADDYTAKATQLQKSIVKKYWVPEKKLFADTADKDRFSEHANTFAILTGTVKGAEAQEVFRRMKAQENITRASIYFRYYVNQALAIVGFGDKYLDQLDIWKKYIEVGATTWPEDSNINSTRSDCHAWGASPNIEFFRIILGIDSAESGFSTVKIEPHLGLLTKISGSMPHPNGEIKVDYEVDKKGKLKASISLPQNTSGIFVWNGVNKELKSGENNLKF